MRLLSLVFGSLIAACGASSSGGVSAEGGAPDGASNTANEDRPRRDGGGARADAAVEAVLDASTLDSTTTTGSRPPPGSSLCGSGTFTPSDAKNVCEMSSPPFPPVIDVTRACGGAGFAIAGGLWEAWCSPGSVYMTARFYDVEGFDSMTQSAMGVFEAGSGSGSTSVWFDKADILLEARVWPDAKSGRLHLLRNDGTDAGVTQARLVYSVELEWN